MRDPETLLIRTMCANHPNVRIGLQALYPFEAAEKDELNLQEGDLIEVKKIHQGAVLILYSGPASHLPPLEQPPGSLL